MKRVRARARVELGLGLGLGLGLAHNHARGHKVDDHNSLRIQRLGAFLSNTTFCE
jgi:hypothetical protein